MSDFAPDDIGHTPLQLHIPKIIIQDLLENNPDLQRNCYKKRKLGVSQYDFTTPNNQYELNETIVRQYFSKPSYTLDRNSLCPTVTSRLEYLKIMETCFLEGLEIYRHFSGKPSTQRWILDIGTGSLAIYPIVGTYISDRNHFIATEINRTSLNHAKAQISQSSMPRIHLIEPESPNLVPVKNIEQQLQNHSVVYTVCNPPFYFDPADLEQREKFKSVKPNQLVACSSELYCPGGEVQFLKQLIDETISLKNHPNFTDTWFSSLVGILSDLYTLKDYLQDIGIDNVHVETFGHKTKRWILAWNFNSALVPMLQHETAGHISETIREKPTLPINNRVNLCLKRLHQSHPFEYKLFQGYGGLLYLVTRQPVWWRRYRRQRPNLDLIVFRIVGIKPQNIRMSHRTRDSTDIINSLSRLLCASYNEF